MNRSESKNFLLSTLQFFKSESEYTSVGKLLEALEMDIDKFDKSQDYLALLWDCAVMRMFRVPEEMIKFWEQIHTITHLVDRKTGVKSTVNHQRKSGTLLHLWVIPCFYLRCFH